MIMQNADAVDKYAYSFVGKLGRVQEIIQDSDKFHPNLFGVIDLSQQAVGPVTMSSLVVLLMVVAAVAIQYAISKQQMPNTKNKRRLRDIFKESAAGEQVDQSEINTVVSGSMMKFLPIMMFFVFINVFGACVLYYLMTNIMTAIQQTKIFKRDEEEMEELADRKIMKDLSKIQEGEVVAAPKEKQKYNITRISASNKKRRKK
jgi:membrane protein insertase Oxa1/YidC/SpoIIIJ